MHHTFPHRRAMPIVVITGECCFSLARNAAGSDAFVIRFREDSKAVEAATGRPSCLFISQKLLPAQTKT